MLKIRTRKYKYFILDYNRRQDVLDWKKRISGVLIDKYEELKTKQRKLFN